MGIFYRTPYPIILSCVAYKILAPSALHKLNAYFNYYLLVAIFNFITPKTVLSYFVNPIHLNAIGWVIIEGFAYIQILFNACLFCF